MKWPRFSYKFKFSTQCDSGEIKVATDAKTGEQFINDAIDPHPLGAVYGQHPRGFRSVWYDKEGQQVGWWKAGYIRVAYQKWWGRIVRSAQKGYFKNLMEKEQK